MMSSYSPDLLVDLPPYHVTRGPTGVNVLVADLQIALPDLEEMRFRESAHSRRFQRGRLARHVYDEVARLVAVQPFTI